MSLRVVSNLLICFLLLYAVVARAENLSTKVVRVFPALKFSQPVDLRFSNDGGKQVFVIERTGLVKNF